MSIDEQVASAVSAEVRKVTSTRILEVVISAMESLRPSERKVAQVVIDEPSRVLHMSVAELARASGVSEPTVIRFAAAVGCDGYQDFKLQLAQGLALGIPATQSVITADDDVPTTVSKVFDYSITSLDHARSALDVDQVERAIEALSAADEIVFLGLGASGIVAQDAQQKFPLLGVPCSAPTDTHQQFIAATTAGPGTAVVGVSNTGRTVTLIDAMREAREHGATTIALTGGYSPLTDVSDIAVIVETLENTDFHTPTISRLAQLVVIDVLVTGVVLRRPADHVERLREMKHRLALMRAGGRIFPEDDEPEAEHP